MDFKTLITKVENDILHVTVNRPKALNALNAQTFTDLKYVFGNLAPKMPTLKGVIVTGAGEKAFVAGADISEFTSLDTQKGSALAKRGSDIFTMIESFHKPVIALVNGFALGGGCELAMACHMRIATPNAKFGQPEVNLGIIPGYGGTQRLPLLIGRGKAMELLLTGDMLGAEESQQLGLTNYVLPAEEALAKAEKIINKIASKAPVAVAQVIDCVNAVYDNSINGFENEVAGFGVCAGTQDFLEGANAFLEKRKPVFKGK